jgi:hypothetical protein
MTDKALQEEISNYSEWRSQLSDTIAELSVFLKDNRVIDLHTHRQFEAVLGSLADDNLSIAFVAEFSRGKSEMINTIFFGDYKQRILPSGTGRTTMCPTELLYDPKRPCSIRLLPIESRANPTALFELKKDTDQWTEIEFDPEDADGLAEALKGLTDSKLVSKAYAEKLRFSLLQNGSADSGLPVNEYDEVEIPSWRHAIVNLPHPLLEQGLVILDTPGLNAIGAEPELTINQLATAHTVVFILSLEAGVTATDLEIWKEHLGGQTNSDVAMRLDDGGAKPARRPLQKLVALNKIDALWDGIRSDEEIDKEIDRQVWQTAKTLHLEPEDIFPVSAQKGLLGRLNNDPELIKRSRITELENAIAERLVPEKRQIVVNTIQAALDDIIFTSNSILNNRLSETKAHIAELQQVIHKNDDVISHIMTKAKTEKAVLEYEMQRYQEMHDRYDKDGARLARLLSDARLEKLIVVTKRNMTRCATSITLQRIISKYFEKLNCHLDQAISQANEMTVASESIANEFRQRPDNSELQVRRLRLDGFKSEINRLEQEYSHLKETKTLFFREQMTITDRFYESVCGASRKIFNRALRDAIDWSGALMTPLETYVRDSQARLRRRLESVKRIYKASDSVEIRLTQMQTSEAVLQTQHEQFHQLRARLAELLVHTGTLQKKRSTVKPKTTAEILHWEHKTKF